MCQVRRGKLSLVPKLQLGNASVPEAPASFFSEEFVF